ncbi:MAG: hypothetical protein ACK5MK_13875 [Dysgonomonas sp.]
MRILLFLTGCINPNGMSQTLLQDKDVRKNQYIQAIKYYLEKTDKRILFVENSGEDISPYFENINSNRLEIISFVGNSEKNRGKGYGEMSIIEYALLKSKFLEESDFIFKITGRYKILNINTFFKQVNKKKELDVLAVLYKNLESADSRMFVCKVDFLTSLVKQKEMLDDAKGLFFENVLSKTILTFIVSNKKFSEFISKPRYGGIMGTNQQSYNTNIIWLVKNIKQKIRYYLN